MDPLSTYLPIHSCSRCFSSTWCQCCRLRHALFAAIGEAKTEPDRNVEAMEWAACDTHACRSFIYWMRQPVHTPCTTQFHTLYLSCNMHMSQQDVHAAGSTHSGLQGVSAFWQTPWTVAFQLAAAQHVAVPGDGVLGVFSCNDCFCIHVNALVHHPRNGGCLGGRVCVYYIREDVWGDVCM